MAKPGMADMMDEAIADGIHALALFCLGGALLVVFVAVSIESGRLSAARWLGHALLATAVSVVLGLGCLAVAPALVLVTAPVYLAGMLAMPTLAIGTLKWHRLRLALWLALIVLLLLPAVVLLRSP